MNTAQSRGSQPNPLLKGVLCRLHTTTTTTKTTTTTTRTTLLKGALCRLNTISAISPNFGGKFSIQNGRQKVFNIVCSMQAKQMKKSMTGNRLGGDHFIARFCDNFLPDCPETAPHPSRARLLPWKTNNSLFYQFIKPGADHY